MLPELTAPIRVEAVAFTSGPDPVVRHPALGGARSLLVSRSAHERNLRGARGLRLISSLTASNPELLVPASKQSEP